MPIQLPPLATIKARALEALNNNALQAQKTPTSIGCAYSGPCAIGVALSPKDIALLRSDGNDTTSIAILLANRVVELHPNDTPRSYTARTLIAIQDAHDGRHLDTLRTLLTDAT